MNTELKILAFSIVLGFVHLFAGTAAATAVRGKEWNMGNREGSEAPLTGVPARINLAFENFKETFPFFAAAILLVAISGRYGPLSAWGAMIYFGARLVYFPVYAAGIQGLRSLVWLVSVAGILTVLASLLHATP